MARDDKKRGQRNQGQNGSATKRAVVNAEETDRKGYQPSGPDFDLSQAFEPQPTVASAPSTLTPETLGEDTPAGVDPDETNAGAES